MDDLFARHPQTRREVTDRFRAQLERVSLQLRSALQPKTIANEETERAQARREKNQFLVQGRDEGAVILWDVYELQGPDTAPLFQFGGCLFQEEAIARARDLLLGRVQVSFGNVRAALRVNRNGLVTPDATIDTPGRGPSREAAAGVVRVIPAGGRSVIVTTD